MFIFILVFLFFWLFLMMDVFSARIEAGGEGGMRLQYDHMDTGGTGDGMQMILKATTFHLLQ